MTKKDLKKSRSTEDLKSQPQDSQKIKELQAQITALLEQISRIKQEANQQIQFEAKKAQNYLEQITKLTAEVDSKEQVIKELTTEKNELADHNNELRINNLKQDNYFTKYQQESKLTQQLKLQVAKLQKDLTITQQDLKSAQRIIELRTIKPDNKDRKENSFDY
ncbi:934_t:CDS:1 [Paraglomus occultum]|uniref:934_t:CDS:1 n=1 Tax=Paraglomus occultum TaxID=144539 RepID=A0A9N9AUV7_9GLOM|nr:934_t:CDS:1 [Paraglomus occultum]